VLVDDEGSLQRRSYHRILMAFLALLSTPIVLMYLWLLLASVHQQSLASFLPTGWTLQHWRFLWLATVKPGYPNIWVVTGNSLLFAVAVMML
jgi:inositol-phosphate transport system permease protein